VIEVHTYKTIVKLPWRLRFRRWRWRVGYRLRWGRAAMRRHDSIAQQIAEAEDRAFLFGGEPRDHFPPGQP
jgi:hypothetical protein